MHGAEPMAGAVDGLLVVAVLFAEAVGLYVGSGIVGSAVADYLDASIAEEQP